MSRRNDKFLLIAIHNRSSGRTAIAIRVAKAMTQYKMQVMLLIHNSYLPLLSGTDIPYESVSNHIYGYGKIIIDHCVQKFKPQTIIYFDYFNTTNFLNQIGTKDSRFLLSYNCEKVTLDTWDYDRTGHFIDLPDGTIDVLAKGDSNQKISEFKSIKHRITPVPIACLDSRAGKFNCLPEPVAASKAINSYQNLRTTKDRKLILFCTSVWQHQSSTAGSIGRMANILPRLLAHYIRKIGPSAKLVHVGPYPYPLQEIMGSQYQWLGSLSGPEFGMLVSNIDLLFTPNISATTISMAFQHNIPVLACINSVELTSLETLNRFLGKIDQDKSCHEMIDYLPLYPFYLWPLGYFNFLTRVLSDNPYYDALQPVEFFKEEETIERMESLLFNRVIRGDCLDRQENYINKVKRLPDAIDVISTMIE